MPRGGFKRVLNFSGDKFSSDAGAKVKTSKSGDLWSVEVNAHEHYQIPEAVVSSG
jgi:hypothetical protein